MGGLSGTPVLISCAARSLNAPKRQSARAVPTQSVLNLGSQKRLSFRFVPLPDDLRMLSVVGQTESVADRLLHIAPPLTCRYDHSGMIPSPLV